MPIIMGVVLPLCLPDPSQSPMSPSSSEDTTSPFFLHNGDHPGLFLVTHQLTRPNYNTWNRSMLMALTTKNKITFIDGTIPKSSPQDLLVGAWTRCDSMVHSWLLNSVVKEIADSLIYLSSTQAVWVDLCERFQQSNAPRIFQIKQYLHALNQGSLDLNTCYTHLKTLWEKLKNYQLIPACNCGRMQAWMNHQEQEYPMKFLMDLNESYSTVGAQILMIDPLPSVSWAFNLVSQEERQRSIGSTPTNSNENMIFAAPSSNVSVQLAAQQGRKHERPLCTHYNMLGHTVDKCYKLHGYPPGYKVSSKKIQAPQQGSLQSKGLGFKAKAGLIQQTTVPSMSHQQGGISSAFASGLSHDQVQQMISFLSSQLQVTSIVDSPPKS